jgi:hypothetical protein
MDDTLPAAVPYVRDIASHRLIAHARPSRIVLIEELQLEYFPGAGGGRASPPDSLRTPFGGGEGSPHDEPG